MTTMAPSPALGTAPLPWQDGLRYGLCGFGLAFVALPLYVLLPHYYARAFGVPLATLGALLLGARLLDALIDPLLGRLSDRLFARSLQAVRASAAAAAVALTTGFVMLFFPPASQMDLLLAWAALALVLAYAGYSLLGILHQSWGAMLGGDAAFRSRVVAWREGLGLAGVLAASALPVLAGLGVTSAVLAASLATGLWAWSHAPLPHRPPPALASPMQHDLWLAWKRPAFRALLAVFLVNGIASAIPATLILFFVQDRLQVPQEMQPLFLGAYFLSAALAIPMWLRGVRRLGLERLWLAGMVLAIGVFVTAATLGPGDTYAFIAICALSGVALGSDLVVPGALLAGVIARHGDRGRAEGVYMGWWNFATKLNLALAAGLALPLLGWLGYLPGAQDASALRTLTLAYCVLPCVLKAAAAALLYALLIRKTA